MQELTCRLGVAFSSVKVPATDGSCKLTRSGQRGRRSSSYPCNQIIGTAWYLSYVIMMSYVRVRRMLSGSLADLMPPLGSAACGRVTANFRQQGGVMVWCKAQPGSNFI